MSSTPQHTAHVTTHHPHMSVQGSLHSFFSSCKHIPSQVLQLIASTSAMLQHHNATRLLLKLQHQLHPLNSNQTRMQAART